MSKLKALSICLSWCLLLTIPVKLLAQTCQSESAIPSSTPTGDFTDYGNGTVLHKRTGLMWMKCPLGQSGVDCATGSANTYTWKGALEAAVSTSHAGYSDWRLPNQKELLSIVERRCHSPAINAGIFPATPSSYFWSSSPYAGASYNAWGVHFRNGYSYDGAFRYGSQRVRLVRSGQ